VPSGTGGEGREGVLNFYAKHFLPYLPPDIELITLSQVFGEDRIVEEMMLRFTHSLRMDWMLPGVPPTGRKAEFLLVGIIGFQNGRVASEHLYWDQATVLSQLGVVDTPVAAAGTGSARKVHNLVAQK
jgi:carboxymethylenebutenolidase